MNIRIISRRYWSKSVAVVVYATLFQSVVVCNLSVRCIALDIVLLRNSIRSVFPQTVMCESFSGFRINGISFLEATFGHLPFIQINRISPNTFFGLTCHRRKQLCRCSNGLRLLFPANSLKDLRLNYERIIGYDTLYRCVWNYSSVCVNRLCLHSSVHLQNALIRVFCDLAEGLYAFSLSLIQLCKHVLIGDTNKVFNTVIRLFRRVSNHRNALTVFDSSDFLHNFRELLSKVLALIVVVLHIFINEFPEVIRECHSAILVYHMDRKLRCIRFALRSILVKSGFRIVGQSVECVEVPQVLVVVIVQGELVEHREHSLRYAVFDVVICSHIGILSSLDISVQVEVCVTVHVLGSHEEQSVIVCKLKQLSQSLFRRSSTIHRFAEFFISPLNVETCVRLRILRQSFLTLLATLGGLESRFDILRRSCVARNAFRQIVVRCFESFEVQCVLHRRVVGSLVEIRHRFQDGREAARVVAYYLTDVGIVVHLQHMEVGEAYADSTAVSAVSFGVLKCN